MFTFDVAASELHDAAAVGRLASGYAGRLERLGGRRAPGDPVQVWLVATGGSEHRIVRGWRAAGGREPCLLVAHPGDNSLPAALETLARIHQLGGRGAIVALQGEDDPAGSARLRERIGDLAARRRLHDTRIGMVGEASDWLVASIPSPAVVRAVWGPDVVEVPMGDLVAAHRPDRSAHVPATGRPADEVAAASGVGVALRALIAGRRLDAVTVRCFDLIGALGTTGCLALASLNDDGVVAGCEGDLVSALGMLWVQAVTGAIPWMANPAGVSPEHGTLLLAHCTVPTRMVGEVRLDTHFESGIGVGIAGEFAPGPVTLLRIGGMGLDRLWLAEGEVLAGGDEPGLCRTQATVRIPAESAEELLRAPLGNHVVMAPGLHEAALRRYHDWLIGATG